MDTILWKEVQLLEQKRADTNKRLRDLAAKERIAAGTNKRKRENENDKPDEPEPKRARLEEPVSSTKEDSADQPRREIPKAPADIQMRNKKLFSVLLMGTLRGAKESLSQQEKSDVLQRRKQLEQKVETKVKEDQEQLKETYMKQLQEEKQQVLSQKEGVESELKEKEVALLHSTLKKCHQLSSGFILTKTAPHLFYLPVKRDEAVTQLLAASTQRHEAQLAAALQKIEVRTGEAPDALADEDKNGDELSQDKVDTAKEDGEVASTH